MNLLKFSFFLKCCLSLIVAGSVNAQNLKIPEYEDVSVTGVNREEGRSTFWYYTDRENAIQGGYHACNDNISLNGKWKFHFCEKPADRIVDFYKPEFNVSGWDDIAVPGSWPLQGYDKPVYLNHPYEFNTVDPYPYRVPTDWNPVGAYRRNFEIPASWAGKRIVLHFGAVKSSYYVFVNGHKVGYSQDSKMQAEFDITPYVKIGSDNVLAVEVYRFSIGSYLEGQDFWRLAGIKRDVWLYATPKVFLQDYFVKAGLTNQYKDGDFNMSFTVQNNTGKTENAELTIQLLDDNNKLVFEEKRNFKIAKGQSFSQEIRKRVPDCRQWNAENPELYTLLIATRTSDGVNYSSSRIGFRTVEIKNAQLLINGQYVYMKGANRHEHHHIYGHYIPKETMEKDVELIKQYNMNAIRTAHYPSDPYFYELCNEHGVYLVDEANIESHGLGAALQNVIDPDRHIAHDPEWEAIHLDRMKRMFQRDKNHPSVIIWSMGNECGDGPNFVAGYKMLRELDPTRFVQSEQAGALPHTDIYCPMYMKIEIMKNYALAKNVTKPLILCEYAHSMGNSIGNLQDYWDLIETYPVLQGGFIWEFMDHGVESTKDGKPFFEYGGGFGLEHLRHDGNFCIDGVFAPDRKPNPHAFEVKKVYQNIRVKSTEIGNNNDFLVVNNNSFTNTNKYTMKWTVIKNGKSVETGMLKPEIAPMTSAIVTIPYRTVISDDAEYFINFEFITEQAKGYIPNNWVIAYDQLPLNIFIHTPENPKIAGHLSYTEHGESIYISGDNGLKLTFDKATGALSSYMLDGFEYVKSPMMPDFYRVRIDNDDWDAGNEIWRNTAEKITSVTMNIQTQPQASKNNQYEKIMVSVKYVLVAGEKAQNTIYFENDYTIYPNGRIDVLNRFNPLYYNGEDIMSIPRIGQVVQINGDLNRAQWYGRGPWENYADRKTSTLVGIYNKAVADLAYDYVRPQENGYRTDVRWLELTNDAGKGLRIEGGPLFCFNAQHTSQKNFYTEDGKPIRHIFDMKKDKDYHLNIDYGQKGVGGDNSWGKPVHTEYIVLLRYYEYGYSMQPIN